MRALARGASLLLAVVPLTAAAQDEDQQVWEQVNLNLPLTADVRVTLEEIARWGNRAEGLSQTEFGGLVSYRVAPGIDLGLGYRRVGLFSATAPDVHENRLRQQVVLTRGRFVGRFRVDERFNPGGSEIGFRIRPLVRYNYPLGTRGFALFASHESFVIPNSTAWGQRSGYERMRNQAGVTVPLLGRKASVDVGYLNQYRFGRAGAHDQMDHVLSVQLTINAIGPILHD